MSMNDALKRYGQIRGNALYTPTITAFTAASSAAIVLPGTSGLTGGGDAYYRVLGTQNFHLVFGTASTMSDANPATDDLYIGGAVEDIVLPYGVGWYKVIRSSADGILYLRRNS
jgi:hypothetical protein